MAKSTKTPEKGQKKQLMTNKYQICRTEDDVALIERLSGLTGITQSVLYRRAVISYYRMHALNQPTCANGHACKCPQFWERDKQQTIAELLQEEVPRTELGE